MDYDISSVHDPVKFDRTQKVKKILNRILNRFHIKIDAAPLLNNGTDMVSDFQRVNFFHLLNRVLQEYVEGDIVELGCFDGQSATFFQNINQQSGANRKLYLYDNFKHDFGLKEDIYQRLIQNFRDKSLELPEIVNGDFGDTIPGKLPPKIAFVHIDCGHGGKPEQHKEVILHCLRSVYDRMSKGAIGVLMDYHVPGVTVEGVDSNPGVKMACDVFFADKPEKVFVLYGGEYSHGYFVKDNSSGDQNQP